MLKKLFKNSGITEKVINQIIDIAKKYEIKKVILFGSRARGDFIRGSDIDLAIHGGDISKFRLDVNDFTDTLLAYDVIDLDCESSGDFLASIKKEGVTIYEEV